MTTKTQSKTKNTATDPKRGSTVVIQCATPFEFEALKQAFGATHVHSIGKRKYAEFNSGIILRGSVGKVWAAASAEFAIGRWSPHLVIDFGAAGGLASELKVGDIVLAEKIIEYDVSASGMGLPQVVVAIPTEFGRESWLQTAEAYPKFIELTNGSTGGSGSKVRVTRGRVASGDREVHTLQERAQLAKSINAIAATWESSAIGRICKFHSVPYFSVRVITDVGAAESYGRDEFLAEYKHGIEKALLPAAQALAAAVLNEAV